MIVRCECLCNVLYVDQLYTVHVTDDSGVRSDRVWMSHCKNNKLIKLSNNTMLHVTLQASGPRCFNATRIIYVCE
jgi:hypothetical protein